MDHLVELTLNIHDNGLGDTVVFSFRQICIISSVITSGQKHCLQAADICVQVGRNLHGEIKYLCAVNIIISGAVSSDGVGGILRPERSVEAGGFIRLQSNLITGSVLYEIHALDLYGYTAVSIFGKGHVGQLCQFIQNLISRVSQVVGMFNAATLNGTDLIVQR